MASARQILGLVKSHAAGDNEGFLLIAREIAGDAQKTGDADFAGALEKLVDQVRSRPTSQRAVPIARPRGELAGLVRAHYPNGAVSDLALSDDLAKRLRKLVREHVERDRLAEKGLKPRRKLLFCGPPGTGKSMTAASLAGELSLPLFTVLLDGVMTKYMGESAGKLRLIFDAMRTVRGVYFFDEVDALATRRSTENDVGEARRVLNSFLQFLDEDSSASLTIAATNHPDLLDPAIHRRFDAVFTYSMPQPDEIEKVLRWNLLAFDRDAIDWPSAIKAATGLSHADLASAAMDAAREAVLESDGHLSTDVLIESIRDKSPSHT